MIANLVAQMKLYFLAYSFGCALFILLKMIGGVLMDYKEAYFGLYSELANIIEQLEELQRKYEEEYIESEKK